MWKNKLAAAFMILSGYVMLKLDNDITILVFALMAGIPLMFSKTDWME